MCYDGAYFVCMRNFQIWDAAVYLLLFFAILFSEILPPPPGLKIAAADGFAVSNNVVKHVTSHKRCLNAVGI